MRWRWRRSGNTWAIAALLASHAGRVVVSNPVKTRAIAEAKIKTDKVEELLAERGVTVDHVTVYRWVQTFTSEFIDVARPVRHIPGDR
jgi:transposase-like protein